MVLNVHRNHKAYQGRGEGRLGWRWGGVWKGVRQQDNIKISWLSPGQQDNITTSWLYRDNKTILQLAGYTGTTTLQAGTAGTTSQHYKLTIAGTTTSQLAGYSRDYKTTLQTGYSLDYKTTLQAGYSLDSKTMLQALIRTFRSLQEVYSWGTMEAQKPGSSGR